MSSATLTKMYHLGTVDDNICYQTDYTDSNFESQGYVSGICPFQFYLSTLHETICDGHSEKNIKYCPDSQIKIIINKYGKGPK